MNNKSDFCCNTAKASVLLIMYLTKDTFFIFTPTTLLPNFGDLEQFQPWANWADLVFQILLASMATAKRLYTVLGEASLLNGDHQGT